MVAIRNEYLFSEIMFCLNLLQFVTKSQVIVFLKFLYDKYQNHVYDTLETHTACLHLMVYFCNLYDHKNLYSHYETNFASCGFVSNTLGSKKVTFKHFLRCNVGTDANHLFLKLRRRKIHSNL